VGVLSNDAPNGTWQTYTVVSYTAPQDEDPHTPFQINANGTFVYTPKPGWDGYDSFTYKFKDSQGNVSGPVTVEIMRNSNVLGNPADAPKKPLGGVALVGGGTVPDAALNFLINQANGGDFVILTYSALTAGPESLANRIWALAGGGGANSKLDSVETIAVRSWSDGNNPAFVAAVRNAEAIFITGGDQSNCFRYWPGYLGGGPNVRDAVNTALSNGAAIGGTSAGMAVLGQVAYSAWVGFPDGGNLTSQQALSDPSRPAVADSLVKGFLQTAKPELKNIVTETHVQPGDRDPQGRMGRLIAFLANMAAGNPAVSGTPRCVASSKSTAILINPDDSAQVVAAPGVAPSFAYFVTAPNTVPQLGNYTPLSWQDIDVIRVAAGGTFNLGTWTAAAGLHYKINVNKGLLSVEGNNDFY
jgi:cyanophycinase-like exopeptidase